MDELPEKSTLSAPIVRAADVVSGVSDESVTDTDADSPAIPIVRVSAPSVEASAFNVTATTALPFASTLAVPARAPPETSAAATPVIV